MALEEEKQDEPRDLQEDLYDKIEQIDLSNEEESKEEDETDILYDDQVIVKADKLGKIY